MATAPVADQGKGKFLREFLRSNRDAKVVDATAAWQAEGHDDGISESLVSKIRSELGLTGKRGSNGRATGDTGSKKAQSPQNGSLGKGKKLAGSPLPPVVLEDSKGPSKSAFVGEVLGHKPEANLKATNEAWEAAGHEGTISSSIFFKVKRERGASGEPEVEVASDRATEPDSSPKAEKVRPAPKAKPTPKASKPKESASSRSNGEVTLPEPTSAISHQVPDHGRELHEIEGEIDELMYRLKGLGSFAEVQEALRTARRTPGPQPSALRSSPPSGERASGQGKRT